MGEGKRGLNWVHGGAMIAVAVVFDAITTIITVLTFGLGFIINWIPNTFAILAFGVWLAIEGEANFKKIAILIAPFTAGCAGVPGWTATIWPVVAKTIAAKTILNKI